MSDMHPEQEYFAHLAQGRFMLQRSRSSGRFYFHPRVAEPVTGARDLEWVAASGRGTVYATTVVRPKPPQKPYNVVLVDLEEGPRVMCRVEGIEPEAVHIGMEVRSRIGSQDDMPILVFDVVGGAA
ncbi:OB-fold domain-containing protein [Variovorax sp. J22R24]|uniref:Zn-ribbon domain-containing OB-fold protein n=1 Tax=Variovorax gracilis TaxID=3053502 RepID=UPI00257666A9|nr:OB-fold domain-containing protein [Variovorax sp. J22R24]MDM0108607.1 OB-fold domain-containing protein [Variovorax sp. J22R24]